MGFPLVYSELLLLPKFLLQMVLLLNFVRRLISSSFTFFGLGDLLDSESPWPDDPITTSIMTTGHDPKPFQYQSISALLIQEILPVVEFKSLQHSNSTIADGSCAVCLSDFEGNDSVRRLINCRHVFHMCCLDRWMEHDQGTCPLCRTSLITEEMKGVLCDQRWAAAVVLPDEYVDHDLDLDDDYDLLFEN